MNDGNNKKALKAGVWYTVANFLTRGIGFITTPVFTRLLSQEEFGLYNNFLSWLSILIIFVTLNLEATLMSARYDYEDNFDGYILSMLVLSSISALVWALVANIFAQQASSFLSMKPIYFNCMFVYCFFSPCIALYQKRERYCYRYKTSVLLSLLSTVGTAVISVVLVLSMNDRFKGRVYGYIIPTVLMGMIIYVFFIVKGRQIDFGSWKYAIRISIPYIPHLLSLTILNSMDRIIITKFCGEKETALYSLAYNCGAIVTMLVTSMNYAFGPWLGEKLSQKRYPEIRQVSKVYSGAFSFLAIGIMLVAPEVLLILGGTSYLEAEFVLAPIAMGCVCQFMYTMFVNVEQFCKKTVGMAIASASAAGINYLLNIIFIPRYGYLAAAYTTLVGYLWLLAVHMFLVRRIGLQQVYSYRYIVFLVIAMLIISIGMNVLYLNVIVRYGILLLYLLLLGLLLWIKRVDLVKLVKKDDVL